VIGPRKKEMPDRNVCSDCDAVISKELGGTTHFPEKRVDNYCTHDDDKGFEAVLFIKKFPYTPDWCPALKTLNGMPGSSTLSIKRCKFNGTARV